MSLRKLFTQFFLRSVIFPYNYLYTQAVAYTTYFELEKPVSMHDTKTKHGGTRCRSNFPLKNIARAWFLDKHTQDNSLIFYIFDTLRTSCFSLL